MGMSLGRSLLIAGGIGALGVGGYMMLKGKDKDKAEEGEGAGQDPLGLDPALTGPPTGTTTPGPGTDPMAGSTMSAPMPGAGSGFPAPGMPGAGAGAGMGGQLQGEQVGPYTVVPDPQSGMQLVFETATQQPVGVLDPQGNMTPITVDAQGNVSLAQEPATSSALGQATGPAPHPGTVGPGSGTTSAPVSDAQRGAVYEQIAGELFANAANPAIGSAQSAPMVGAANLTGTANLAPVAGSGAGGISSRQVGEFTLLDDGSGITLVLETASQKPVGVMDAAGNVTPITVDAQGNVAIATPTTPAIAGAAVPAAPNAAMPGGAAAMTGTGAPIGAGF
jgi:hypothetical protein